MRSSFSTGYDDDDRYGSGRGGGLPRFSRKLIAIASVVVLGVVIAGVWALNSFARVEPGFVGLVRNGGPFDNRNYVKIITPSDGMTNVGFASTVSEYPDSQRFDNVIPGKYGADPGDGDSLEADAYRTRTSDGQDIGIQGQWKFTLNTNPAVLEKFDAAYGTRTYQVPGSDDRVKVSDSDQGMAVFIASQLRSVQEEAIRQGIGSVTSAQLDPSFGLLTVTSTDPAELAKASAAVGQGANTGLTFTNVSDTVTKAAQIRINQQLGAPITVNPDGTSPDANDPTKAFVTNIRFTLQGIAPSTDAAKKIEDVRTSVAKLAQANADAAANVAAANGEAQKVVADANGRKQAAALDADAQVEKQRGYTACTTCADIDRMRAQGDAQKAANEGWKQAPQVYAPGNAAGPFVPIPGR